MTEEDSENADLSLGELKKFQSLKRSFLDRRGYRCIVLRKQNNAVVFDDTKGILARLYWGSAHFLYDQGSHRAIVILADLKNENARREKLFDPVG